MAACLNAKYAMWTNGDDRYCFAKKSDGRGGHEFDEIIEGDCRTIRGQLGCQATRLTAGFMMVSYSMGVNRPRRACGRRR